MVKLWFDVCKKGDLNMFCKVICLYFVCLLFIPSVKADGLLKDIGIIGLASHDIFAWDRKKEINTENGRLDLSTIFDYENGDRWKKGGNPKNTENSPVWSITKRLVNFHKKQLKIVDKVEARKRTVKHFHEMIKLSFF